MDDYLKIVRRSHHGLLPRYKMGFQVLIGIGVFIRLSVAESPAFVNGLLAVDDGAAKAFAEADVIVKQRIVSQRLWRW